MTSLRFLFRRIVVGISRLPLERTRRLPHAQLRVGVYERDGGSPDTAYEALPI